jgi:hypothetical protein
MPLRVETSAGPVPFVNRSDASGACGAPGLFSVSIGCIWDPKSKAVVLQNVVAWLVPVHRIWNFRH